jgi:hypothetical protein
VRALLIDLSLIALTTAVAGVLIKSVWRGFTYWGDNAESFLPLWHMWGTSIRSGQPFLFDHTGWGAANMVGEAAYELFNPVTAVNAVFISLFDNLDIAGFIVAIETLVLLGWGVYGVARSYGARRAAALIVGCVAPFAGFTLFYEAGNWLTGLLSVVWTLHFWWAAHNFARRRIGPIWPFIFGALAAVLGSPYATICVLVVLVSIGLELLIRRDVRRFLGLVAVGAAVGAMLVLAYIALIYALPYSERQTGSALAANGNYLTPSLSDIAAFSAPTYLPRMNAWYNRGDFVPSTYLAWFALPLVPWLRYGVLREWRRLFSLYAFGAIFLLCTLGPDQLWLFRWPIRFSEYLYVALFVLLGVLLSRGFDTSRFRLKIVLTALVIAAGAYMSWSSTPGMRHFAVAAVVAVLMIGLAYAYRRWDLKGVAVVIAIGTILFAVLQGYLYGWNRQQITTAADQPPPASLSMIRQVGHANEGRVLQIADLDSLHGTDAVSRGELVFGNIGAAAGFETINRYSGINFVAFKDAMGLDYRGSIGQWVPLHQFFDDLSPRVRIPVVDALGVDTLVVASNRTDIGDLDQLAAGWHVADTTGSTVVLVRDVPLAHPVLHEIGDVDVDGARESGEDLAFGVQSADGGTVLVDRLAWPGYSATMNGETLDITQGPYGLMMVEIPPGADGQVVIRYAVPGLPLGLGLAGAAVAAMTLYQVIEVTARRRKKDDLQQTDHISAAQNAEPATETTSVAV